MHYPSIEQIISICDPLLNSYPASYRLRFDAEIKDLKKWMLFLQTDKASEILALKDKAYPSNKSGSLILFLLNASTLDPLILDTPMNKKKFGKADPPDIDIDLNPQVRDSVKSFLVEKFGRERVCSVGTVGTYKTKNVILDVVRALGLDVKEANEVTKGLDIEVGDGDDEKKLDKASFEEICQSQPELAAYFEKYPDVLHHSEILRNQAKNTGTHAGGVVISNLNLLEKIPVFKDKEDRIVSCWSESGDAQDLSSMGLIKFDVLGLCLEENTLIKTDKGSVPIKDLNGHSIFSIDSEGSEKIMLPNEYILTCTGKKELIKITLEGDRFVTDRSVLCSPNHKFFLYSDNTDNNYVTKVAEACLLVDNDLLFINDEHFGYMFKRILSMEKAGMGNCYDITLLKSNDLFQDEPNFILGNGIVSHNCNLPIIDDCLHFIESNKGKKINRSDIPIDDKESIRLGTRGELLGIFQFENPYTKKVADRVGCDSLADIAAITSLIRPGPKDVGLDMEYAERKNGKKYDHNQVFDKVMGQNYNILVYQENVQMLGIHMGGLSPLEANRLRKGASKKKKEIMDEMKPKFIQGAIEKCVKTGIMTEEQVIKTWDMIESTASYSFNKSVDIDTPVWCNGKVEPICFVKTGDTVFSVEDGKIFKAEVKANHDHGFLPAFEVEFEGGRKVVCSILHKFETCKGKSPLWSLLLKGEVLYSDSDLQTFNAERKNQTPYENISSGRLLSARFVGFRHMCDLEIHHITHNYILANGLVSGNSHAIAYSAVTTAELWLRKNYFCEYMTALIQNADPAKEKFGTTIFDKYIKFSIENGLIIHKPNVNESRVGFRLQGQDAFFGLGHVKNVSSSSEAIVKNQPYSSFEDFYERCLTPFGTEGRMRKLNSRVVESLIYAGTFDCWGSREAIMKKFYVMIDRIESMKLPRLTSDVKDYVEFFENEISLDEGFVEVIDSDIVGKIKKTKVLKDDSTLFEPMIDIQYDDSIKYIDLPVMSDKFLMGMEEEMLGVSLSGNLAVKYREYTKGYDLNSLVSVRLERDKVKVRIMGKIIQIKDVTFKNGNNGLRIYITDGIKDYNFLVFANAINTFKDFYQEGDVAIIPLKNMGEGYDDPTFRFFDDKSESLIIEREGTVICNR